MLNNSFMTIKAKVVHRYQILRTTGIYPRWDIVGSCSHAAIQAAPAGVLFVITDMQLQTDDHSYRGLIP